jgi:hypothetical protein
MSTPPESNALIKRFNNELDWIEGKATEGLELTRIVLELFPENPTLVRMFAFLNNVIFFVNIQRSRLQIIVNEINVIDVTTYEEFQEIAGKLDSELDRILETKSIFSGIIAGLKKLK